MGETRIMRFAEIPEVSRGAGVESRPLAGPWMGFEAFTSGITTFPPGMAIKLHSHNVDETVTILEGDARVDVADESYSLGRLDTTYVPAGIPHRFVNASDGVLRILWTYVGPRVTRTFTETGITVEHLSGNDLA